MGFVVINDTLVSENITLTMLSSKSLVNLFKKVHYPLPVLGNIIQFKHKIIVEKYMIY